jgi:hypothetical protein
MSLISQRDTARCIIVPARCMYEARRQKLQGRQGKRRRCFGIFRGRLALLPHTRSWTPSCREGSMWAMHAYHLHAELPGYSETRHSRLHMRENASVRNGAPSISARRPRASNSCDPLIMHHLARPAAPNVDASSRGVLERGPSRPSVTDQARLWEGLHQVRSPACYGVSRTRR